MRILFFVLFLVANCFAITEIDKAFLRRDEQKVGVFALFSPEFYAERKTVPKEHFFNDKGLGCSGDNISPSLYWKYAPKDAKYFAILMQDISNGWYHWALYNIPHTTFHIELASNQKFFSPLPWSVKILKNDFGEEGYGGPCMIDDKKHQYKITIYAFPDKLKDVKTPAMLSYLANKNSIASASVIGIYDGTPKQKEVKQAKKEEKLNNNNNNNKRRINNNKKQVKKENTKKGKTILNDLLKGVNNLKRKIVE